MPKTRARTANYYIETLGLERHPEGGYYRETYRAAERIEKQHLPERFGADHSFCTAIYYLLRSGEYSAFHRLNQDEVWHFYDGAPLHIHTINRSGDYQELTLGLKLEAGERPQIVIPGGWIFAASVAQPDTFTLIGCTVAPGFEFADFRLVPRNELLMQYPQHRQTIELYTNGN